MSCPSKEVFRLDKGILHRRFVRRFDGGAVLVPRVDDERFTQLGGIAGHRVGVGIGTTFEEVARTVQGADVRTYDSFQSYSQQLMTGRLDVITNDQLTVGYAIETQKLPMKITSGIFNEDIIGIAIKKDNEDFGPLAAPTFSTTSRTSHFLTAPTTRCFEA